MSPTEEPLSGTLSPEVASLPGAGARHLNLTHREPSKALMENKDGTKESVELAGCRKPRTFLPPVMVPRTPEDIVG